MTMKDGKQIDDIDIFELVESLWKDKVLIIAITAVITLIGMGYARLTPSTYEARVEMLHPSFSDIAELNKFNVFKSKQSQSQSQSQIFKQFLNILKSNHLRKKFLQEEGVMKSLFEKEVSQQKALNVLASMIEVEVPKKESNNKAFFKLQFNDAELTAKFANQLVNLAIEIYRTNISLAFESERYQKIKQLNNLKNSIVVSYEEHLDQEITKLKEAYQIAKKLEISEPLESRNQTMINEARHPMLIEELRYLYSEGTRVLNTEIETVIQRKNNHKLVDGVIDIEQELSLINTTSFEASKVVPITIDLAAQIPEGHIKPKRSKIVLLSVVIGGFLAIIFVLFRNAVRNRKAQV